MSVNRHAVERWVGNDLQNVLAWTSWSDQWVGRSRMALLPGNCLVEEASHRARIGTCQQTCRWTRYIKIKAPSRRLLSQFCRGTKPEKRLCMSQTPPSMEKFHARKEQEGKTQFLCGKTASHVLRKAVEGRGTRHCAFKKISLGLRKAKLHLSQDEQESMVTPIFFVPEGALRAYLSSIPSCSSKGR